MGQTKDVVVSNDEFVADLDNVIVLMRKSVPAPKV
jgi:hypothetical protein